MNTKLRAMFAGAMGLMAAGAANAQASPRLDVCLPKALKDFERSSTSTSASSSNGKVLFQFMAADSVGTTQVTAQNGIILIHVADTGGSVSAAMPASAIRKDPETAKTGKNPDASAKLASRIAGAIALQCR